MLLRDWITNPPQLAHTIPAGYFDGYVYLVAWGQMVKVGRTQNPTQRMKHYLYKCPHNLEQITTNPTVHIVYVPNKDHQDTWHQLEQQLLWWLKKSGYKPTYGREYFEVGKRYLQRMQEYMMTGDGTVLGLRREFKLELLS